MKVAPRHRHDAAQPIHLDRDSMSLRRASHGAALLPDGRVLVAGGSVSPPSIYASPTAGAEIYDPDGPWGNDPYILLATSRNDAW